MGNIKKSKEPMTTIQVTKSVATKLQSLGRWGDTYSLIIECLLNGSKGAPYEDRGAKSNESTGISNQESG